MALSGATGVKSVSPRRCTQLRSEITRWRCSFRCGDTSPHCRNVNIALLGFHNPGISYSACMYADARTQGGEYACIFALQIEFPLHMRWSLIAFQKCDGHAYIHTAAYLWPTVCAPMPCANALGNYYSWKYWQELNLVVESQITIAKMSVDFSLVV